MNKQDLVAAVATTSGLTHREATLALDVCLQAIAKSLAADQKVVLVGFGSFDVSRRAERQGVNPRTREKMTIKAQKVPRFRPGKDFQADIQAQPEGAGPADS